MDWKKELKSWGWILGVFGILYFTGLIPVIQGGLQSILLATGIMKPNLDTPDLLDDEFDFTGQFKDLEGNLVNLENYRGKTIFINLWASWCGPCRAEMPHISELYKSVKDNPNIAFLLIGLDQDFNKSKKFMEGKTWDLPTVHASFGVNKSLESRSIPTSLVVNPSGKIVFYLSGMRNFNTDAFRDFLLDQ